MFKKVLLVLLLTVVLASTGLFFWARAVFTQEGVRAALAAQLSNALGQPVTISSIGVAIYPRLTVNLGEVAIGEPARVAIERLHVGTNLGALLSRRIEHADLRLAGARVELPLPEFTLAPGADSADEESSTDMPVEIVSIDEIVLRDVQIVSGGRTLRGDVELVPQGGRITIREATLRADDTAIDVTGQITDPSGPVGELSVAADALNFDELLAFVSDFAAGAGADVVATSTQPRARKSAAGPAGAAMDIAMSLSAGSAKMGTLTLESLSGRARITPEAMTLEPIGFGLFGGTYDGTLSLSLGDTTDFRLAAGLSDVDMAAATTFAGSPDTITGRLSGKVDLFGSGMDAASVLSSARGSGRVDIANGTVRNLGLVRTIIVATSGRADASPLSSGGSRDEPFERLGATLALAHGVATTSDLRFESSDLLLSASGTIRLDGSAIDLTGQVQLSEALAKQAGRDLVRYTQDQGRPTLPIRITGSADNPQVMVDVAGVLRRAITNRAREEVQGAIKKGLGGLFQK